MTPPKVPGAPKPQSSDMMSSTLGAPWGGTTRGAHQGLLSEAFCLITPPNAGSGGGSCWPLSVVVAWGEPGSPCDCGFDCEVDCGVVCDACRWDAQDAKTRPATATARTSSADFIRSPPMRSARTRRRLRGV